jgi:cysteine desulfurase/selenocysteine lyase
MSSQLTLAQARELFPVVHRRVYLDNAAVAPLPTPARHAMERQMMEMNELGPAVNLDDWIAPLDRVRAILARLVNAAPGEIAFVKNTSEGLSFVARGLAWKPGDRIVGFDCEFPANVYPWLALRPLGVQVDLLPGAALGDLDRIRQSVRGAKLLAVSSVQFLSGYRAPLEALGAICRELGVWFVVDGIQSLGAFPLDVKRAGIHALSADGHKWLVSPEAAGFLYLDPALMAALTPVEVGWLSVAGWDDLSRAAALAAFGAPLPWRPDATRFECGALNRIGLVGMGASVEMLLDVSLDAIARHLLALGHDAVAGLRRLGCEVLRQAPDADLAERRSGINTFRHPARPAEALIARLRDAGILCALRQGWVRVSPHLYNNAAEIERLLDVLAAELAHA